MPAVETKTKFTRLVPFLSFYWAYVFYKIIGEMSNVINRVIKSKKHLSKSPKKMVMNRHEISRLLYKSPIILGELEETKSRVYKVIHNALPMQLK